MSPKLSEIERTSSNPSDKQMVFCLYLLLIGAVLVNIKSIFTDLDVDSEYAVAMSYRMLQGDNMFAEMWEAHQTSAFLTTFLMYLYKSVVGTLTGVVLFLHCIGVGIQGTIAVAYYHVMKKRVEPFAAFLGGIFFFIVRPKSIVFPEYSNMQIWFAMLLFLCLLHFFDEPKKKWLLAASVCQCLLVLSYPSCLIVYFPVILILYLYTEKKARNIIFFSAACLAQGMCYILYFAIRVGIGELVLSVKNIVESDSSHGGIAIGGEYYFTFLLRGCVWLICCFGAAVVAGGVWYLVRRGSLKSKVLFISGIIMLLSDVAWAFFYREPYTYLIAYILLLLLGIGGVKYCNEEEKRVYVTGVLLSLGAFISTMLLTNLDFLSIVAYVVLSVAVSFVPLEKWMRKNMAFSSLLLKRGVLLSILAMILLHRGIMVKSMSGWYTNLLDLGGIVKAGPAMGIVTDYMGAYETNCDVEDWDIYIKDGDRLLLVAENVVNTLAYTYRDVTVGIHSTICTPTYDDKLLEYWEKYPEKEPNVIAVSCWYGDLRVSEKNWIIEWLEDKTYTWEDGRFWRFYRLSEKEQ